MAPLRVPLALVSFVGLAFGQAGHVADVTCDPGAANCPADDTSLLQRQLRQDRDTIITDGETQRQSKRSHPKKENAARRTLSMEGGGFKAHACYTGITSGLLHWMEKSGEQADLKRLFGGIDIVSTNSGGSWFWSMMAYSSKFKKLVEDMAKTPADSPRLYYQEYLEPFFAALRNDSLGNESRNESRSLRNSGQRLSEEPIAGKTGPPTMSLQLPNWYPGFFLEILIEMAFAGVAGNNYDEFVQALLEGGGGIPSGATLGSEVNEFVRGKDWYAVTSVPSIGGEGPGTCSATNNFICTGGNHVEVRANGTERTAYNVKSENPKTQTSVTPGRFSIVLGDKSQTQSPLPFCSGGACDDLVLDYTSVRHHSKTRSTAKMQGMRLFDEHASEINLAGVVSSSSAFAGILIYLRAGVKIADWFIDGVGASLSLVLSQDSVDDVKLWLTNALNTDWAMWTAHNDEGTDISDAFAQGRVIHSEVQQSGGSASKILVEKMARMKFQALIDGGFTDNTGVGAALAAGTTEVVAWADSIEDFWGLCTGTPATKNVVDIFGYDTCPMCSVYHKVFKETEEEASEQFRTNGWVLNPPSNSKTLSQISVGTMHLTTIDAPVYGVEAGRQVTVHLVYLNTTVSIGGAAYRSYAELVKEIIDTIASPASKPAVQAMLSWMQS